MDTPTYEIKLYRVLALNPEGWLGEDTRLHVSADDQHADSLKMNGVGGGEWALEGEAYRFRHHIQFRLAGAAEADQTGTAAVFTIGPGSTDLAGRESEDGGYVLEYVVEEVQMAGSEWQIADGNGWLSAIRYQPSIL